MQEAPLPKWAKPKKSATAKETPLVIRAADSEVTADELPMDSPTLPAVEIKESVVTALGLRPCQNARWVLADMDGKKIKVRVLKSRKSPRGQTFRCRHLEADLYEEIR